ncbi:hypothetical protein SAY87_013853 [Trapa incisa]|uniref:Uncharacterized protein n=1 Tax=Trapa incisa TaxID=236973 RepID=A0AAN7KBX1_9MYRT|nr:hypothetical protein SAY87_013853 [Trapa incisa]
MKNKASLFLKQIISSLASIAKSKSSTIRSKAAAAHAHGRYLLLQLTLVKKKAALNSISSKIHGLLGHGRHDSNEEGEDEAMVVYIGRADGPHPSSISAHVTDDDKYPDLRHSLFDEGEVEEDDDLGRSVIDIVKDSKEGSFILEDDIDQVADLFIKRFYRQIRLQKLESFKRLQAMLARGT